MARMSCSLVVEGEYDMEEVKGKPFPFSMGVGVCQKERRGREEMWEAKHVDPDLSTFSNLFSREAK